MEETMDLCRVCLATVADGIQTATLFSTTYQTLNLCDMLSLCTALVLDPNDGLPNLICANCLANLITSHEFRVQCHNTDQKLRDILQMAGPKEETVSNDNELDSMSAMDDEHQEHQEHQEMGTQSLIKVESEFSNGAHSPPKESHMVEEMFVESLVEVVDGDQEVVDDEDHVELVVEHSVEDTTDGPLEDTTDGPLEDTTDGPLEDTLADEEHAQSYDEINGVEEVLDEGEDGDDDHHDHDDTEDYKPSMQSEAEDSDDNLPLKKLRLAPAESHQKPKRQRTSTFKVANTAVHRATRIVSGGGDGNRSVITALPRSNVGAPAGEFPCTVCDQVFNKLYRLNAHMNTHAVSKKYYECDKCKVRFPSDHALARHRVKHDQNIAEPLLRREDIFAAKLECNQCNRKFSREDTLASHLRDHEEAAAAAAEAASGAADGVDQMRSGGGGAGSSSGDKFLCEHCPRVFTSKNLLNRHIRSHTGAPQFDCEQCERSFMREEQLVKHMLRHDTLKKHNCPVCDKIFTHVGTLKSHMKTHSDSSPFLCCECGKSFGNSGNLKTHMMRHSGERPYECTQCFSRFPIKGDLHNHMKTHTGVRPATCDVCGSSFTRQSTLNKHKLIHIGIRPYPCEMCDMRFSSSDHVKRHMRIHTGEKPFKCNYCPRAFTQKNDLVKHTRSHIGENTYQCKQCPAAYRLFNDLKVHARTHQKTVKELLSDPSAESANKPEPEAARVVKTMTMKMSPSTTVEYDEIS